MPNTQLWALCVQRGEEETFDLCPSNSTEHKHVVSCVRQHLAVGSSGLRVSTLEQHSFK